MKKIQKFEELLKYDEIVITGGEPMLIKDKLFNFLLSLRDNGFKGKIFMYTALWDGGIYNHEILDLLDGITFTLHNEATKEDIYAVKVLSHVVNSKKHLNSRLFIDNRIYDSFIESQRRFDLWDEVRKLEWKDECQPAQHEDLVEFLL